MSRSPRHPRSQRISKSRSTDRKTQGSDEPKAIIKGAYIGAAAAILAALIAAAVALYLNWPKHPHPYVAIQSWSQDRTSTVEIITVNGIARNLGVCDLVFVVASPQPQMAPIVGGPAFISTAGTWTIQLQVPLSYSGGYNAGLVESELANHFLCYSPGNIARSRGYLQSVGPAGLSDPTGSVVVPPLPKISSAQATRALLTSQEIASITRSRVIDSVVSKNYVPILDLSSSTTQMLGSCRIAPNSLLPFIAHSPVRTGRFSSASIGEVNIGEQLVVYEQGYGMEAFEATKAMLGNVASSQR